MTKTPSDPLWHRLRAFQFDDPDARLDFSGRLARENTWSREFALRVIDEYRRFCYLARKAGHPVTPSDQVDQAWHLHLVYTESYWQRFCGDVLEAPLHHGPTRGGRLEGAKYRDWYSATLISYQRHFGAPPPADIWPDPAARFRDAGAFRRVNAARYWLLPKPDLGTGLKRALLPGLAASLFLTACAARTFADFQPGPGTWLIVLFLTLALGIYLFVAGRKQRRKSRRKDDGGCGTGCAGCGTGGRGRSRTQNDNDSGDSGDSGCGGGCGGCSD